MKTKIITSLTSFLLPVLAFAAFQPAPFTIPENSSLTGGGNGIVALLRIVANWMFTILLLLAVIFIIYAAFIYLTSAGDTEKAGKGHKIIIYAAVAIGVAILAKGLVFIVAQLVGASSSVNGL